MIEAKKQKIHFNNDLADQNGLPFGETVECTVRAIYWESENGARWNEGLWVGKATYKGKLLIVDCNKDTPADDRIWLVRDVLDISVDEIHSLPPIKICGQVPKGLREYCEKINRLYGEYIIGEIIQEWGNINYGPDYWVYFNTGWNSIEMECGTIHEANTPDCIRLIKYGIEKGEDR